MKTETITLKSGNGDFLNHKYTEVYQPKHVYIFNLECKICHTKEKAELKSQDLFNYHQGESAWNVFSYIKPETIRLMIDGWCDKCDKNLKEVD